MSGKVKRPMARARAGSGFALSYKAPPEKKPRRKPRRLADFVVELDEKGRQHTRAAEHKWMPDSLRERMRGRTSHAEQEMRLARTATRYRKARGRPKRVHLSPERKAIRKARREKRRERRQAA